MFLFLIFTYLSLGQSLQHDNKRSILLQQTNNSSQLPQRVFRIIQQNNGTQNNDNNTTKNLTWLDFLDKQSTGIQLAVLTICICSFFICFGLVLCFVLKIRVARQKKSREAYQKKRNRSRNSQHFTLKVTSPNHFEAEICQKKDCKENKKLKRSITLKELAIPKQNGLMKIIPKTKTENPDPDSVDNTDESDNKRKVIVTKKPEDLNSQEEEIPALNIDVNQSDSTGKNDLSPSPKVQKLISFNPNQGHNFKNYEQQGTVQILKMPTLQNREPILSPGKKSASNPLAISNILSQHIQLQAKKGQTNLNIAIDISLNRFGFQNGTHIQRKTITYL